MKNKWYLLVIVLLLGALALSACGGGAAEQPAATEAPAEEAPAEEPMEEPTEEPMEEPTEEPMEEPTEEPMEEPTEEPAAEAAATLRIWADENRVPVLESLKDQFLTDYGIELVIEQVALGDMGEQVRIAIPAGEGPDIFIAPHDQLGNYVAGGLVAPIDLGDKIDSFVGSAIQAFTYDGELYGMPYATENVAFFRNTELVPDPVETWDDVRAVGEQLVADGVIESVTVLPNTNYHIYGLHTAYGGYIFGRDDAGSYNPQDVGLDSEGFIASAQYLQEMVEAGLIPATADGQTADALFGEGQIPFVLNGPWALNAYREAGVPYAIDPIPAGPDGPGAPFLGVQGFVVNALSENQLLAQTFLTELVATDDVMQAFYEQDPRMPAWVAAAEAVDDEDLLAFGQIAPIAQPMPAIPEMGAVWGSWGDAIQLVLNQELSPEEALTNAAEQVREAIGGSQ